MKNQSAIRSIVVTYQYSGFLTEKKASEDLKTQSKTNKLLPQCYVYWHFLSRLPHFPVAVFCTKVAIFFHKRIFIKIFSFKIL